MSVARAGGAWGVGGVCREEPHRLTFPPRLVKQEAQDLIELFFHNRSRCESAVDWHGLFAPQS